MHIKEVDASTQYSRIDHKSEDGKGTLTAEVYTLEIDVHGWRVWGLAVHGGRIAQYQVTDWLCRVDNLCFNVLHIDFEGLMKCHREPMRPSRPPLD
ncbi:hypothetical protein V500_04077 [Pseudogymnoascus sp. VKM F-4518 (FW-2643)]|nr:hypothetical protein V500_04077 [Pseudogymnoascus sp. VKM F-4518 (FW-2643)]